MITRFRHPFYLDNIFEGKKRLQLFAVYQSIGENYAVATPNRRGNNETLFSCGLQTKSTTPERHSNFSVTPNLSSSLAVWHPSSPPNLVVPRTENHTLPLPPGHVVPVFYNNQPSATVPFKKLELCEKHTNAFRPSNKLLVPLELLMSDTGKRCACDRERLERRTRKPWLPKLSDWHTPRPEIQDKLRCDRVHVHNSQSFPAPFVRDSRCKSLIGGYIYVERLKAFSSCEAEVTPPESIVAWRNAACGSSKERRTEKSNESHSRSSHDCL